jgi:hypothetical protein
MKHHSDIDRVMQVWMADGPTAIPDRVVDVVAARIGVQRQRRGWPFLRRLPMNPLIKLGAAAAAVLVVAVVGWNLLPGGSGPGGPPSPTPQSSPTATPSGSPTATGPLPAVGTLAGGRYHLKPLDDPSSLSIVADIPAGWQGFDSTALVSPGKESNTGVLIGFMAADGLFSDACHWDVLGTRSAAQGDVVVGPTVDALVAALKANTSYTSSAATPITVGGFDGQEIELQLPGSDVITACDTRPGETTGDYFVFPNGYYAQGPNSHWHLYIVDVDGTRLITMVSQAEGTPQADIAAAKAIVESFEITP